MNIKDLFNKDLTLNKDVIDNIPAIMALHGCSQHSQWHQEGDAYVHTKMVCDQMEKIIKDYNITSEHELILLRAAALFHDIGKPIATKWDEKENEWKTNDHGKAGEIIVRRIFFDDKDILLREQLCYMVRNHMSMHYIKDDSEKSKKKLIKMSYGWVSVFMMYLLNVADSLGSISVLKTKENLKKHFHLLENLMQELNCAETFYRFNSRSTKLKELNNLKLDITDDKNDKTSKVYIMCGIPGSGKSTYIKDKLGDIEVISRDIIRHELGYSSSVDEKIIGSREQEKRVTEVANERMIKLCEDNVDFVIDNMNLKYDYRRDILEKVLKYKKHIIIIYVEPPTIDDAITCRMNYISPDKYVKILDGMTFPNLYEADCVILNKR